MRSISPGSDPYARKCTRPLTAAMDFRAIADRLVQHGGQCICIIGRDQPTVVTVVYQALHTLQIGGDDRQSARQSFHDNIGPTFRAAGKDEYVRLGKALRHIGGGQSAGEREAGRHTAGCCLGEQRLTLGSAAHNPYVYLISMVRARNSLDQNVKTFQVNQVAYRQHAQAGVDGELPVNLEERIIGAIEACMDISTTLRIFRTQIFGHCLRNTNHDSTVAHGQTQNPPVHH